MMSLILVPVLGIIGGAIALFVNSIFLNLIYDFFDFETKQLGRIKLFAILGIKYDYKTR